MPSIEEHHRQAKFNEEAAESVKEKFPDWSVTMCFYAALHLVDAHGKARGIDIPNDIKVGSMHQRRFDYIRDLNYEREKVNQLRNAYVKLRGLSEQARYMKGLSNTTSHKLFKRRMDWVQDAFSQLEIIKNNM